jgi:catechol 2,3-dioxygenase-like lactoylglutathione lyase family enzyme
MSIFTHVCIAADDLDASARFYDATLQPLGIRNFGAFNDRSIGYGADRPEMLLMTPLNGEPACPSNGSTVGFAAPSRDAVDAFHTNGLVNGGTDEGAPGPRGLPGSYAAYLRDPNGNKICAYAFVAE